MLCLTSIGVCQEAMTTMYMRLTTFICSTSRLHWIVWIALFLLQEVYNSRSSIDTTLLDYAKLSRVARCPPALILIKIAVNGLMSINLLPCCPVALSAPLSSGWSAVGSNRQVASLAVWLKDRIARLWSPNDWWPLPLIILTGVVVLCFNFSPTAFTSSDAERIRTTLHFCGILVSVTYYQHAADG